MEKQTSSLEPIVVPRGYRTSLIYMDESGSATSGGGSFVVVAAKLRHNGQFDRAMKDIRDKHGFFQEFKFSQIRLSSLPAYLDLVDAIENSELKVAACVVDKATYNPFKDDKQPWEVHAAVATQVLVGCITKYELVSVLMDGISTPRGISLDDHVRSMVNKRLRCTAVITAACLDSRCTDGLQVADLLAGAVAFDRKTVPSAGIGTNPHKAKVVARLKLALGVTTFGDGKVTRVNIATYRRAAPRLIPLPVVSSSRAS
jgi:hypothetical protein